METNRKTTLIIILIAAAIVGLIVFATGDNQTEENADQTRNTAREDKLLLERNHPEGGAYLTDASGRTLYIFTDDSRLESGCAGACAENWPPFLYDAEKHMKFFEDTEVENVEIIQRGDGSLQFAYYDSPLYYYAGDRDPGDLNGNGLNGKWFIIVAE